MIPLIIYIIVTRTLTKLFESKILYSAYGEEPPKNITDLLKEEYGIDD